MWITVKHHAFQRFCPLFRFHEMTLRCPYVKILHGQAVGFGGTDGARSPVIVLVYWCGLALRLATAL